MDESVSTIDDIHESLSGGGDLLGHSDDAVESARERANDDRLRDVIGSEHHHGGAVQGNTGREPDGASQVGEFFAKEKGIEGRRANGVDRLATIGTYSDKSRDLKFVQHFFFELPPSIHGPF